MFVGFSGRFQLQNGDEQRRKHWNEVRFAVHILWLIKTI
jgi:hypothetical protein